MKKLVARGSEPWDKINVLRPLLQRRLPLILLVALVSSCEDRRQDAESANKEEESPKRSRSERASRETFQTSNSLRKTLQAARKQVSATERDRNFADIAWKALERNPEIALEAIQEMSFGTEDKKLLIEAYIQMLLAQGRSEEAEECAASLGNEIDAQTARSKIGEILGYSNPAEEALALSEADLTGEVDPTAEQVIRNWAARNPNQAAEWLRKMPEGEARENGFKILLGAWVVRDTSKALTWISTQPNSQFRQEVLDGAVGFLNEQPPPIRDSLLEGIDETIKREILQRIGEMSPHLENDDESAPDEILRPETETYSEPSSEDEGEVPSEERDAD